MSRNGQIVEIPAKSLLYKREIPIFSSKQEELVWNSAERTYSLFDGFLVGEHPGVENFKIGQRKGINVGGKKAPLYVIAIDKEDNRLFVGEGDLHPGLLTKAISFSENEMTWISEQNKAEFNLEKGLNVEITSSVLENEVPAMLYQFDNQFFLEFKNAGLRVLKDHPIQIYYNKNQIILINN